MIFLRLEVAICRQQGYRPRYLPRFVQGAVPDGMPKQRRRGAVPAGGIANPHPGGFGSPVDRHKDRSARSVLNRCICRRDGQNTCQPTPRETRFWS
jgi:hypothetical protein